MKRVVLFGGPGLGERPELRLVHRRQRATIEQAAAAGLVGALVIDAREREDFVRGVELLRALLDDPRRPRPALPPQRVLAVIRDGDTEAAFTLGRYGIAGVVEQHELAELPRRLERALSHEPERLPLSAPSRPELLRGRPPDALPTVTVGYRHAPETLAALERYQTQLRAHAHRSTVFADVAELMRLLVAEGLSCQTNLATKAGVTHTGQFIGAFEYYRQLRHTRYARIPDHPTGAIAMDVFIGIDEILHEVLHLLFLANEQRAGLVPSHPRIAEELALSWWQGVVHGCVFPEWIRDRAILEINDDFTLCEDKQEAWEFWTPGHVFAPYADYPWVRWIVAQLPERPAYIGPRGDLPELLAELAHDPRGAFLHRRASELAMDVPFASYPEVPPGLRVGA